MSESQLVQDRHGLALGRVLLASPLIRRLRNLGVISYLVLALLGTALGDQLLIGFGVVIGTGLLGIECLYVNRRLYLFCLLGAVLLVCFMAASLYHDKLDKGFLGLFVANLGIACVLLREVPSYKFARYIYYSLAAYMLVSMLSGVNANNLLARGSRNGVSVVMIATCCFLYVTEETHRRRLSIWPAILTLAISIMAIGRAGIVASSVLLIGVALSRRFVSVLFWVASAVTATYAYFVVFGTDTFVRIYNSFLFKIVERGFSDSPRVDMLRRYLDDLNFGTLIFGENLRVGSYIATYWHGNPHNSFVHGHGLFGVGAFLIYATISAAIFKGIFLDKVKALLLVVLLLRGATDSVFFVGLFDFLVLYLTFAILSGPEKPEEKNAPLSAEKESTPCLSRSEAASSPLFGEARE